MRFRIDVNTLDGKLSYERDAAADALEVAQGARESLGVTITDTEEDKSIQPGGFRQALRALSACERRFSYPMSQVSRK